VEEDEEDEEDDDVGDVEVTPGNDSRARDGLEEVEDDVLNPSIRSQST